jgi:hypothetical protein
VIFLDFLLTHFINVITGLGAFKAQNTMVFAMAVKK